MAGLEQMVEVGVGGGVGFLTQAALNLDVAVEVWVRGIGVKRHNLGRGGFA